MQRSGNGPRRDLTLVLIVLVVLGCGSRSTERASAGGGDSGPGVDAGVAIDAADLRDGAVDALTPDAASAVDDAHQVLPCTSLAPPGQWENITPPQVTITTNPPPYGIFSVVIDPTNSNTIYASSDKQGIYKSPDCGASWSLVNTGRNADVVNSGSSWYLTIDPADPNVLYVSNGYGNSNGLLKSTDAGVDWDIVFPPNPDISNIINFVGGVTIDPADHQHLLLTFHDNCKGAYAPACAGESSDAGSSWRLFKLPTSGWSHSDGLSFLTSSTWLYLGGADGLFWTGDSGASWTQVADYAMGHTLYRAQDGSYLIGSGFNVLRSLDGMSWSAIPNSWYLVTGLTGDGERLFASADIPSDGKQPVGVGTESDPTAAWSPLTTPDMDRGGHLVYDPDHHILYSASLSAGAWRVVTH
jgi:photosystem II stability/assembly factor-like uncharacterized protein